MDKTKGAAARDRSEKSMGNKMLSNRLLTGAIEPPQAGSRSIFFLSASSFVILKLRT